MTVFAVIADVHGNTPALRSVLQHARSRGAGFILNLGDSLWGPLEPQSCAVLLRSAATLSIAGNEDRLILDSRNARDPTLAFIRRDLGPDELRWLAGLSATAVWKGRFRMCHGIPGDDTRYLLEDLHGGRTRLRSAESVDRLLSDCREDVILCAHSHVPRCCTTPAGRLVINPGSVGLQAYRDDHPVSHIVECGSPHARYALIHLDNERLHVEFPVLPYNWSAAAALAAANGRRDWSAWLLTGRAAE